MAHAWRTAVVDRDYWKFVACVEPMMHVSDANGRHA